MDVRVSSRIDEYSRDTAIIIWWLQSTSSENGWVAPSNGEIVTRQLREQADIIVNASVRMPLYVKRAFSRALALRKICQVWFEVGNRTTPENIASHRHFIQVLEDCYIAFDSKDFFDKETSDEQDETVSLSNAFAAMMVEYLSSSDEAAEGSSRPVPTLPLPPPTHDEMPQSYNAISKAYYEFLAQQGIRHIPYLIPGGPVFLFVPVNKDVDLLYEADPVLLGMQTLLNKVSTSTSGGSPFSELFHRLSKGDMGYSQFLRKAERLVFETADDGVAPKPHPKSKGKKAKGGKKGKGKGKKKKPKKRRKRLTLAQNLNQYRQALEAMLGETRHIEFIESASFRELADIDKFLTQVCMDIYLVELLGNDSAADMEARRLCLNPPSDGTEGVWDTGVITVESVFAAVIFLDFKEIFTPPNPTLRPTQRVTFVDVKKRVYRDRSFYPFESLPSQQAEDREEFTSGKVPRSMYHQYMESRNLGHVARTYAFIAETLDLIPMDSRSDFLYLVDPILLGTHTAIQGLSAKPNRTALGDLLLRLQYDKINFTILMKEVDKLAFRQGHVKKPGKSGKQKGKGKAKGKGKTKSKNKATKVRLTLPEGVMRYAESIERLCKELTPDT
ncbi:uncharacterized protein PG986_002916 [Apiospora aurea]|uniref:DUF6604 domain-containing protein n=1 Tax=Apiospora aurea TaxID=335848 RepID=A0ABR1QQ63_9PEZI